MRYVAAYMLGSLSGKEPTSTDIEKILGSVGVETDLEKVELVLKELKGKNVDELIAKGRTKISTMPTGGAAIASATAAAVPAAAAAVVEKKEEKKPEKEDSESDEDMGFGLFD